MSKFTDYIDGFAEETSTLAKTVKDSLTFERNSNTMYYLRRDFIVHQGI